MNIESFNFIQYLSAKKTVDDRALNRAVLENMSHSLQAQSMNQTELLHILEVAAGIGTMFERLVEWNLIPSCHYTMVDINEKYITQAKTRVQQWAEQQNFEVQSTGESQFTLCKENKKFEILFQVADAANFSENNQTKIDLVIAHAFLDFADVDTLLPKMFSALKKGGFFYFSVNFDGETILLPEIESDLDKCIIEEYHKVMDNQKINENFVSGTKVGRKLFCCIQKAGAEIMSAGSSDWVVFPQNNKYIEQEDYFLHCIIDTIAETLRGKTSYDIDSWIAKRHEQIKQGKLIYIAHQLDFFGRYPEGLS